MRKLVHKKLENLQHGSIEILEGDLRIFFGETDLFYLIVFGQKFHFQNNNKNIAMP